jgi:pSer/pThr/pTyr-binding forkhead associated (FHA) protein
METVLTGKDAGRQVLVVRSRSGEVGKRVTVDRFPFVVGRGSQAHLTVDTERASRAHARIERVGEEWHLVDLESANGTFLNGEPVTGARALVSGDVIGVGEVELEWHVLSDDGLADGTETAILEPR